MVRRRKEGGEEEEEGGRLYEGLLQKAWREVFEIEATH